MELWWLAENQRPQVLRDDVAICGTKKVMTSHPDGDAGWCWGQAEGLAVVVASTFRKNGPKFNHLQQLRRGSGHCGCRRCKWALACLLGCWSQNLWQRVESRWLSWPPAHLNSSVPLNYIPLRYTHIYIYIFNYNNNDNNNNINNTNINNNNDNNNKNNIYKYTYMYICKQ